nr:MAG TPA: hypothetical protein [Caudoviricetes sp.]DAQ60626.1 MAG TPA: hypothetical protein [Bacteriophage sp.]
MLNQSFTSLLHFTPSSPFGYSLLDGSNPYLRLSFSMNSYLFLKNLP